MYNNEILFIDKFLSMLKNLMCLKYLLKMKNTEMGFMP